MYAGNVGVVGGIGFTGEAENLGGESWLFDQDIDFIAAGASWAFGMSIDGTVNVELGMSAGFGLNLGSLSKCETTIYPLSLSNSGRRYHLKLDCEHSSDSSLLPLTSSEVCLKYNDVSEGEICVQSKDSCPEFYFSIPQSESLLFLSVTNNGNDALLVDRWELKEVNSGVTQSWWADNGGARCISNQHDEGCWPDINDADIAVWGVRLFMSLEVAQQYDSSLTEPWTNVLYETGHACTPSESFDQCSNFNTCLAGVCSSTFVTSTSTRLQGCMAPL